MKVYVVICGDQDDTDMIIGVYSDKARAEIVCAEVCDTRQWKDERVWGSPVVEEFEMDE